MRNKSVLFYKLGSYTLIAFALVHTLSFFVNPAELLTHEEDKRVWQLLQTHVFNIGGQSTTVKSLMRGFNLYLEILTLGAGVLNLFIVKYLAGNASALRIMAAINSILTGSLVIVTAIFFHLPPLVLFGLTCLFFLLSFVMFNKLAA
jgi:hypothetical protein